MGGNCSPEHRTVSPDDNSCANFWGEVCVLKSCVQVQGDMMSNVYCPPNHLHSSPPDNDLGNVASIVHILIFLYPGNAL